MPEGHLYVARAFVPAASALLPTLGELCSPGELKHAPPMRRSRLEMAKLDTMSRPRTSVETSLDTAGTSACATYFAQGRGMRQKLWGGQSCPGVPSGDAFQAALSDHERAFVLGKAG